MYERLIIVALGALTGPFLAGAVPAFAQAAPQSASGRYSVADTLVGTLLDDPAAAAVLKRMIPTVYANDMFQQNARPLTLKNIQQYEPEALSDANLARIQAELAKLTPKG